MDPAPIYRYLRHYEDAYWGVGTAPDRCDEFADEAIDYKNSNDMLNAYYNFGYSTHYIVDPGIPFHSKGMIQQGGNWIFNSYETTNHVIYEQYIQDNWHSGYTYKDIVTGNTNKITVTNPISATQYNADYSAQYYDTIWDEMVQDPNNFGSDSQVILATENTILKSAKYTHGLHDYIF